jgi:hypothetical protein
MMARSAGSITTAQALVEALWDLVVAPRTLADLTEESETPVPNYTQTTYFEHTKTGLSGGSGSSEERNFGAVGQMPQGLPKPDPEKNTSDLHRRGSLDERTMTMGNTRLFIANPDLSD